MLPHWLQEKLATPPAAGTGIHAWLFSVARHLHAHMPPDAVGAVLTAAAAKAERAVSKREICDAVKNSLAVAWRSRRTNVRGGGPGIEHQPGAGAGAAPDVCAPFRWPKADPVARRCRIADASSQGVSSLVDLWEHSPAHVEWCVDDWLDWLFPDVFGAGQWLCLATDHPATARSRLREKWSFGPAEKCGLIVPSPMLGPGGVGRDGERAHRCLSNTGPRQWLVIEFDRGTLDEQAALHWHLRAAAVAAGWPRLAVCVHSGGKSLHGWYGLCQSEENSRELMAYAASLGADTAGWPRCQLMRLPGGLRREGVRQEVFFFDPDSCKVTPSSSSSSAPGEPADSMPRPAAMATSPFVAPVASSPSG